MRTGLFTAITFATAAPLYSADVDYVRDVKPILQAKCIACHGGTQQKARLRLDAGPLILKGSKDGPVVVPGQPGESPLIDAVVGEVRDRMPPVNEGEALTAEQIATLKAWISQGAKVPDEPTPADPRTHWAYRPR